MKSSRASKADQQQAITLCVKVWDEDGAFGQGEDDAIAEGSKTLTYAEIETTSGDRARDGSHTMSLKIKDGYATTGPVMVHLTVHPE